MQAKFVLVKLCTSSFEKFRASEILSMCNPRNGLFLKNRASEIRTSEIRASQGPPVCLAHNEINCKLPAKQTCIFLLLFLTHSTSRNPGFWLLDYWNHTFYHSHHKSH